MIQQSNTTNNTMLLYELQQLLIQIKTCNDVGDKESRFIVGDLSKHGLQMLHYALFAIENQQTVLPLTSMSAAAAMHEVYNELAPLAASYGATLHFDASSSLDLVYANETSLKGSVYALVAGIITGARHGVAPSITLAVQQTKPKEQRIGIYSDTTEINLRTIRQALPKADVTQRMGANGKLHKTNLGFAVSTLLTSQLQAKLESFEHKKAQGVGFYMPESAQLQLV
jgi:hypothetical protein